MQAGSRRAVFAALLANLGIAATKALAFWATGATVLLAESVHSLADSGNQLLLLWGDRRAARAPSPEHPFGHGRERYFYGFVVSVVLFGLGGVFSIREGVQHVLDPKPLAPQGVSLFVLAAAALFEARSLAVAIREANAMRGDMGWWQFIRRSKTPEVLLILLEDFGAICGLALGFALLSLAAWTGDSRFDGMGSIGIGVLLCILSAVVGAETRSLLIGERALPSVEQRIRQIVSREPSLRRLVRMRTLHIGPNELFIGLELELDPALHFDEVADVFADIERRIRERLPDARFVYIEPVRSRDKPRPEKP